MKKGSIAFGILLIIVGGMIILTPKVKRAFVAGYFDFTGFNVPFGVLLVIVGLVCIWFSLPPKGRKQQPRHLICPTCETVRTLAGGQPSRCVTCDVDLEDLRGFYDRHPELRNNT
jgi:hypothetical protein